MISLRNKRDLNKRLSQVISHTLLAIIILIGYALAVTGLTLILDKANIIQNVWITAVIVFLSAILFNA